MKVAIKWKGGELQYVDAKDLEIGNVKLCDFFTKVDNNFSALKQELEAKQNQINELTKALQAVRLENIEVVKGLISR